MFHTYIGSCHLSVSMRVRLINQTYNAFTRLSWPNYVINALIGENIEKYRCPFCISQNHNINHCFDLALAHSIISHSNRPKTFRPEIFLLQAPS